MNNILVILFLGLLLFLASLFFKFDFSAKDSATEPPAQEETASDTDDAENPAVSASMPAPGEGEVKEMVVAEAPAESAEAEEAGVAEGSPEDQAKDKEVAEKLIEAEDVEEKEASASTETEAKAEAEPEVAGAASRYVDYSPEAFAQAAGKKRVYFFHAQWCPSCILANRELNNDGKKIPEDVMVFKIDYDNSEELKTKYAVTYQHTFVYVDAGGNEVKKWNGGAIDELIDNTK